MKVKALYRFLLSLLIAVGVLISGISPEGFHHHHDELHCDLEHENSAVDSCHQAVFHHDITSLHSCTHDGHLSENHHHCQYKDYFLSHRNQLFNAFDSLVFQQVELSIELAEVEHQLLNRNLDFQQGRAPPIA